MHRCVVLNMIVLDVCCVGEDDESWMGNLQRGDEYFMATRLEPISHGVSIYTVTKKQFWVFPDDVRVVPLEMKAHNGVSLRSRGEDCSSH